MATNKRYTVKFRRYRIGKTDYKSRLRLLISRRNRLVVRKTINQIYMQVIGYAKDGDIALVDVCSNKLRKYGWQYKLNNLPSCYLTGFLLGLESKKQKITELNLDIGLRSSIKGSAIYSALKGVVDAGIKINFDEKILPSEDRIKGKHIADYANLLKKHPETYKKQFANYLKNNVAAEDIVKSFDHVKEKILGTHKNG